jgi:glucose-1-phosphate cytidylyltransferase
MKALILAGGFGSRLEEVTKFIPKPLVKVGKYPILIYIIKIYLKYNVSNFVIALGYKGEKIPEYFMRSKLNKKDKLKLKTGLTIKKKLFGKICNITFLNTGLTSMTGGRVKIAGKFIKDENFHLTYGDGLSTINLNKLKKFHFHRKKLATITAVRPPPRFGELIIKKENVKSFSEKKTIKTSWINGGFFIINRKFLKLIKNSNTILEREPLEKATKLNQLCAFKHEGFWQCMDTKRDKDKITSLIKSKKINL